MPQVTLQFSTKNSLLSGIIRYFTRSQFSHVEFVLPKSAMDILTHKGLSSNWPIFSKKYPIDPDANEILVGAITEGFVIHGPWKYTKVQRYNVDIENEEDLFKAIRGMLGTPYWWRGIISWLLAIGAWRQEKGKVFCSDAVELIMEKIGTPMINPAVQCSRITPENLYMSVLLH